MSVSASAMGVRSLKEIRDFLNGILPGMKVTIRDDVFTSITTDKGLKRTAFDLASIKVKDLGIVHRYQQPLYGEISFLQSA